MRGPAAVRFWAKVSTAGPIPADRPELGPCWVWTGCILAKDGYGRFRDENGRSRTAHRWLIEHLVGRIPAGMEPDHLCRNRACVNPSHLEVVTKAENTRRGESFAGENARKTHCPNGHPYDAENTYRWPGAARSSRQCIPCKRQRVQLQRSA